jgi:phenylacetate-coenzyme A ligase PaaK-like adenylate-forming protein
MSIIYQAKTSDQAIQKKYKKAARLGTLPFIQKIHERVHHHLRIYNRNARALDVCVSSGVTGMLYLLVATLGRDMAKDGLTIAFSK